MKKRLLILGLLLFNAMGFGQERINFDDIKYDNEVFIFERQPLIQKSKEDGTFFEKPQKFNAPLNGTFTIHQKLGDSDNYVIQFKRWKTEKSFFVRDKVADESIIKAQKFNFSENKNFVITRKTVIDEKTKLETQEEEKVEDLTGKSKFNLDTGKLEALDNTDAAALKKGGDGDNTIFVEDAFFVISKEQLLVSTVKYNPAPPREFSFGTIAYLARIRPRVGDIHSKWTTDLAAGITFGMRQRISDSWGVSLLGGVSITKVVLDSVSTRGNLVNTSEKVALSPTLNVLLSYKRFSLGYAIGMDWVNEDSVESANWIYNKKLFWAFGIGFNIFTSSEEEKTTSTANKQKK